jgi:hypothetical protein
MRGSRTATGTGVVRGAWSLYFVTPAWRPAAARRVMRVVRVRMRMGSRAMGQFGQMVRRPSDQPSPGKRDADHRPRNFKGLLPHPHLKKALTVMVDQPS